MHVMLQPDVGQLLRELRTALGETVLPAVSEPGAKRQLKAALHLLGRLSRTWDLPPVLVRADNADMADAKSRIEARLAADMVIEPTTCDSARENDSLAELAPRNGVNDPALATEMARNLSLRSAFEALEQRVRKLPVCEAKTLCLDELHALFARMTDRESMLVGDIAVTGDALEERPQE
jgi:hypothetical protein